MGRLAQEALGCQAEVLCGGLGSPNRDLVLQHIVAGHPLLIPYPRVRDGARLGWGESATGAGVPGPPRSIDLDCSAATTRTSTTSRVRGRATRPTGL